MKSYLLVIFAGIIATSLYNYFSCLLRELGNSTIPLVFLAVSAFLFLLYGYYRAVKKPGMSVILTVISLGTRVAFVYLLSNYIGEIGIWMAIPIGWVLADAVGLIYMKLPETNLNVVVRVVLETDDNNLKNSVMTFYRIRDKNLKKLIEKNRLLYKKE